ncbi:MAG: hypothetical protein ACK4TL_06365 [Hyphomicrobiaceae bacterium]
MKDAPGGSGASATPIGPGIIDVFPDNFAQGSWPMVSIELFLLRMCGDAQQ